jgi:hypothetical protein
MINRNLSLRQKMTLALFLWMTLCFTSTGQTGSPYNGGQTLLSRTADTLVAANGYGNYKLSFSQWDPRLGKLMAIQIKTVTKVQYGFILRNVGNQPDTFILRVGHKDTIESAAIASPYGNTTTLSIGSFPLDSVKGHSRTPYTLINNYINTDSITDHLESFVGSGKIIFSFSPVTWSTVESKNNSGYYYSATIRDTTRFSLTYIYAGGEIPVAASLTRFMATPADPEKVTLGWTIAHETAGRQYEVQWGRDGQAFDRINSPVISEPSGGDADYQNNFLLPSGSQGKFYFRLKMTDSARAVTYSDTRELTIAGKLTGPEPSNGRELMLYPNPAKEFIHLTFNDPVPGDWQVDILSSDGRLMQRNSFFNTNMAMMYFHGKLPAGLYFASATDSRTSRRYVGTFVIR